MNTDVRQQILIWIKKYGLPAVWLMALPFLIWGGSISAPGTPNNAPYPFGGVLLFAGIASLEVGLLYLILRPHSFYLSWGRFLVAVFIFTPLWFVARLFQDVPGYFYGHALWLGGVLRLLFLGLVLTFIAWFRDRRRQPEE